MYSHAQINSLCYPDLTITSLVFFTAHFKTINSLGGIDLQPVNLLCFTYYSSLLSGQGRHFSPFLCTQMNTGGFNQATLLPRDHKSGVLAIVLTAPP